MKRKIMAAAVFLISAAVAGGCGNKWRRAGNGQQGDGKRGCATH